MKDKSKRNPGVLRGPAGFDDLHARSWGERWPALRASLLEPVKTVARLNEFKQIKYNETDESWGGTRWRAGVAGQPNGDGPFDRYAMDLASVYPALALGVRPGDDVLDLCAAPGGKTLLLLERWCAAVAPFDPFSPAEGAAPAPGPARFVANEMSERRRYRLRAVLRDYVPDDVRRRVEVTGRDGSTWGLREPEGYDRILVDAPCSGERHLLADEGELAAWSPARSKNLAVRQHALLASALQALRPGGRCVYSTCSISPEENDRVIAKLLKKRSAIACVRHAPSWPLGEATEHGHLLLPDRDGCGPIYFATIERRPNP